VAAPSTIFQSPLHLFRRDRLFLHGVVFEKRKFLCFFFAPAQLALVFWSRPSGFRSATFAASGGPSTAPRLSEVVSRHFFGPPVACLIVDAGHCQWRADVADGDKIIMYEPVHEGYGPSEERGDRIAVDPARPQLRGNLLNLVL
jgi:hypothetical protein